MHKLWIRRINLTYNKHQQSWNEWIYNTRFKLKNYSLNRFLFTSISSCKDKLFDSWTGNADHHFLYKTLIFITHRNILYNTIESCFIAILKDSTRSLKMTNIITEISIQFWFWYQIYTWYYQQSSRCLISLLLYSNKCHNHIYHRSQNSREDLKIVS